MNDNQLDNFGFDAYTPYASACSQCAHFSVVELNCKAFPDGIPSKFLDGSKKHDSIEPGQQDETVFTRI